MMLSSASRSRFLARGLLWVVLLTGVSVPSLRAQCVDPSVPGGGFTRRLDVDQPITYSDGYRTMADVSYPSAPPEVCGWPIVVIVHGLGNNKDQNRGNLNRIASRGYVAVAYDVRGQGNAIKLNPGRGHPLFTMDLWTDLAEVIEWTAQQYPGIADLNRVGVTGFSQGGIHSWAAAALSGRTQAGNPRRSRPFPVIKAVVPVGFESIPAYSGTLGGTAFSNSSGRSLYRPRRNVVYEPRLIEKIRPYIEGQDPRGMYRHIRSLPGSDFSAELAQSTVPVMAIVSWLDAWGIVGRTLDDLASLPASTPKRAVVITGHHRAAINDQLRALQETLRIDWFDRFLKGGAEAVEDGPPFLTAALPADPLTHLNRASLWRLRADTEFPPRDVTAVRYYLRSGGRLSTSAPVSAEVPGRITHRVPPGYDVESFQVAGGGVGLASVARILAAMPLSEVVHVTDPVAADVEIAGIPKLRVHVTSSNPDFLLSARLDAMVPGQSPQILSIGGRGFYGVVGSTELTLDLDPIGTVLPAGTRLRLSLRNHHIARPADEDYIRNQPVYADHDLDIRYGPGFASSLELPFRPWVRLDAAASPVVIELSEPRRVGVGLRSSSAWSGLPYALLLSQTGQGPAVTLPGGESLFLVLDALTGAALGAGGPAFSGLVGLLDAQGNAQAAMDFTQLRLPISLLGTSLHVAPVALNGARFEAGAPLIFSWQ